MRREHQDLLRRLALNDPAVLEALPGAELAVAGRMGMDDKTVALVRLAALVALGAASASYQWAISDALAAGATDGEVVGVLGALVALVGTVRVESAVADIALGLGRDLDVPGTA